MTLEVVHRHEKLAPESGVKSRPAAQISGAGFWTVCQGPKIDKAVRITVRQTPIDNHSRMICPPPTTLENDTRRRRIIIDESGVYCVQVYSTAC